MIDLDLNAFSIDKALFGQQLGTGLELHLNIKMQIN
jgi:hypothetical protein